jgi:hypothetical protein
MHVIRLTFFMIYDKIKKFILIYLNNLFSYLQEK